LPTGGGRKRPSERGTANTSSGGAGHEARSITFSKCGAHASSCLRRKDYVAAPAKGGKAGGNAGVARIAM